MHASGQKAWALVLAAIFVCLTAAENICAAATADPYSCTVSRCGIPHEGAYDQLVVGKVVSVGSLDNAQAMFRHMRATGLWQALPNDETDFSKNLIPIVIDSGQGDMTVLMARWEFSEAPLSPGDLVRYSPHNGGVEPPPADSNAHKYWDVDGCVFVLCRSSDLRCFGNYSPGIYRRSDGAAISARDLSPLLNVPAIDPVTMLRKKSKY